MSTLGASRHLTRKFTEIKKIKAFPSINTEKEKLIFNENETSLIDYGKTRFKHTIK